MRSPALVDRRDIGIREEAQRIVQERHEIESWRLVDGLLVLYPLAYLGPLSPCARAQTGDKAACSAQPIRLAGRALAVILENSQESITESTSLLEALRYLLFFASTDLTATFKIRENAYRSRNSGPFGCERPKRRMTIPEPRESNEFPLL